MINFKPVFTQEFTLFSTEDQEQSLKSVIDNDEIGKLILILTNKSPLKPNSEVDTLIAELTKKTGVEDMGRMFDITSEPSSLSTLVWCPVRIVKEDNQIFNALSVCRNRDRIVVIVHSGFETKQDIPLIDDATAVFHV